MAIQYTNIVEDDFGRGIDARSTENQIGEGFVRDLLNADVIQKSVRKRTGYQSYAGNIPVRTTRLDYIASKNQMCLTLDSVVSLNTTVSLESVRSSPLVIYGRVSGSATGSGPITTTDSAHYYDKFTVPIRKELLGTSGTLTVAGTEHGFTNSDFFCNMVQSTSLIFKDYEDVELQGITIADTTYDLSLDYNVQDPSQQPVDAIVYYKNQTLVPGDNYIATLSHAGGGSQSFPIPTTTHNLVNYNIVSQLYEYTGSGWVQVHPQEMTVDNSGNVNLVIICNTATTYKAILSAAPTTNVKQGGVNASDFSAQVEILNVTSPWVFYNIYLEQTPGGTKELVFADSVEYIDADKKLVLTFQNAAPVPRNFIIYYEYGDIRSNVLCVEDVGITDGTDMFPQVTIWGLDHNEIYTTKTAREGWTNHIDTYRRSGEQRVIAGLGGNLFAVRNYSEIWNTTTEEAYSQEYLYPTLYSSLQSRTDSVRNIGPVFYDTNDTPNRTRGYITTSTGGTNWVTVSSVEYDAGNNGWTKYVLDVPNMLILNSAGNPTTIGSVISSVSGLEDWLTVQNMSYSRHNGTFRIRDYDDTVPEKITIWVENSNNSEDYDDPNTGGRAGIFTDQVTWLANCSYIPDDTLQIGSEDIGTVYTSTNLTTVIGPLADLRQIAAGVLTTGRRQSSVIPMRKALPDSEIDSVENAVRGDMLSYTGINRLLRIISINADSDRSVTISGDGETATVTLSTGDTSYLSANQKIIITAGGIYSGVHSISDILSQTQFTFATTHTDTSVTANLSGKTIQIDEELEWADTSSDVNYFQVDRRWIPIEAPDDNFNLTPTTYVRHFDSNPYSDQPFIRSTMVADNLYLTNNSDAVMKFDGQNIYRAGLPAWQPGLFAVSLSNPASRSCTFNGTTTVTTASTSGLLVGATIADGLVHVPAGATITQITNGTTFIISATAVGSGTTTATFTIPRITVPDVRSITYTGLNTSNKNRGQVEVNGDDMYFVPIGTQVIIDGDPNPYTVRDYADKGASGSVHVVIFDRAISSVVTAAGTITEIVGSYKYYFRLNAVDANDNTIASAVTSSDDFQVRMTGSAAIQLKLVGMPTFDNYNYSRLEVEIYRTLLLLPTTTPVFYKVTTLGSLTSPSYNFDISKGYLEYIDTTSDSQLTEVDPTSVLSAGELGIGWSDPLRAKYITTANNRLVLGNVSDYPEFDIQIDGPAKLAASVFAGDTLLFRKDATDSGTVTNMVDRVKFEWRAGFTGTANSYTILTNQFQFTTSSATGAAIGDWIYLTHSTAVVNPDLKYCGWWQIADISGTTVTVNLPGASATSNYPNQYVIATDPTNVPVYLGPDGSLGQVNGDSGNAEMETFDATRRLALALNSCMRQVDTTLTGMADFKPWLMARSGNDVVRAGKIIVRCPIQLDTTLSIIPTYNGYSLFINSIAIASGSTALASEKIFPSRILVSYEKYPEIYDSPTATLDVDSISAIDINPADGQEITGIIPFFGEAAFTAAQQAGILVVFKTNSIYLVDINQKVSGGSLVVQRLETQGLGCTAPYSIAPTKNGIMFANNSGIYCLRRTQAIEYLGKFMERNWTGRVDSNALSLAQGHHYGVGRMYKLSVPLLEAVNPDTGYIEPSEVYVYNHTQEDEENRTGAWSRYDNHTAIGWANLASDAFWASTGGVVYILRASGTETDFRDSNEGINFRLDTRPNDYGNSGIRKVLDKIVANYRSGSATASNTLSFSVDLEQEYSPTTPFRIAGTQVNLNGIDDQVGKDIITLRHSLDRRKGVYFSVRIENSNLDENVEVAGLDHRVGGLDTKGILSASKT